MSSIHSRQIVPPPPSKRGYTPHPLHGITSMETQLAKRIVLAKKSGTRYFAVQGELFVRRDDGEFVSWDTPGWWLVK